MDQNSIERAAQMLGEADAVVIAASNGFDIADGYNQFACDEAFLRGFGDFNRAYGMTCLLQGLMARWGSQEARWAFLARLWAYGHRDYEPSPVMRAIDELTREKPRFVVTCNCNGRFEKAGFAPETIFETEGSFARLRCTANCTDEDFEAAPFLEPLLMTAQVGHVSAGQVPRCPHCGALLDVAVDDTGALASTKRFQEQQARFESFLQQFQHQRVLVLELGIGQRNQAIKRPLMAYAAAAPQARYAAFNREAPALPPIGERAVAIVGDLGPALEAVRARCAFAE